MGEPVGGVVASIELADPDEREVAVARLQPEETESERMTVEEGS